MTNDCKRLSAVLKDRVDEKRYLHSLGVQQEARLLAEIHGVDPEKASLAGLMHDVTKRLSPGEHLALIRRYAPGTDPAETQSRNLLHAITAPIVLEHEFGISDPEILSAVRYHTTARPFLTLLEKILFVADFTEPNRNYSDASYYRKIAREDLDKALFLGLCWGLGNLLDRGEYIYKNTFDTYNYYITHFDTAAYLAAFQKEHGKDS